MVMVNAALFTGNSRQLTTAFKASNYSYETLTWTLKEKMGPGIRSTMVMVNAVLFTGNSRQLTTAFKASNYSYETLTWTLKEVDPGSLHR
ncbi:hypothetical protein CHS0354_041230 [Potamilus streckersoni]|uniref:Uncharacterized protein n=1 Tax=Potamilus streckersoni TaxID=2493646 RepID=A0AAE0VV55_9BIVA|nr:hypothetical protein CHS0354_041230 [Potamilus streckersoni]